MNGLDAVELLKQSLVKC